MNTHEVALTRGEGRSIWLLGDLYTFKVTGEALSVTELTAFPQNGPPPHIHHVFRPEPTPRYWALPSLWHRLRPPKKNGQPQPDNQRKLSDAENKKPAFSQWRASHV